MKTQLSKPARSKARYTDEYKEQALQLWRASGRSAANITACDTLNSTHINFVYYDDNRLKSQEVWTSYYGDNHHRTLTSTYDEDGNRISTTLPGLVLGLTYEYTGRNQPWKVSNTASGGVYVTYGYDASDNRTVRRLNNGTLSTYLYDPLNRVTSITHPFANGTATLEYGYDKVGNRKYVQRDDGPADGFGYDLKGQLTSFQRDGALTNGVVSGGTATSLVYDASGNRSSRTAGGTTFNYSSNGLNQYSGITGVPAPTYDANGNLKSYNGWTYTYDAMNRLVVASGPGATANFSYDGLNRQVARSITGIPTKFSVWDGWELYAEYEPGNVWSSIPIQGAAGDLLEDIRPSGVRPFFFGDGLGSTSQVGDSAGNLIEKYSYDAFGAPRVYEANGVVRPGGSAFGVNYLFAGQRWLKELALSDNRHRFYSPEIGRFLQPDPIGFAGDSTNLYRYCGNNPVNGSDPLGLDDKKRQRETGDPPGGEATTDRVTVNGSYDFDNRPNGFREVTDRNGGIGFLNQGGGRNNGVGGTGIRFSRNSNKPGTSLAAPRSTQGYWTHLDGLPTADSWVIMASVGIMGLQGSGQEFASWADALKAAIDSHGSSFAIEAAGWIFRNANGTFGYTDPRNPGNSRYTSYPGYWPSGTYPVGSWHLHPGNGTFSLHDIFYATSFDAYGTRSFIGLANGSIGMFVPLPTPDSPLAGIVVQLRPPRG